MVKAHSPAERKVLSAGWHTLQSLRSDTAVPQVHKPTVASVNDLWEAGEQSSPTKKRQTESFPPDYSEC